MSLSSVSLLLPSVSPRWRCPCRRRRHHRCPSRPSRRCPCCFHRRPYRCRLAGVVLVVVVVGALKAVLLSSSVSLSLLSSSSSVSLSLSSSSEPFLSSSSNVSLSSASLVFSLSSLTSAPLSSSSSVSFSSLPSSSRFSVSFDIKCIAVAVNHTRNPRPAVNRSWLLQVRFACACECHRKGAGPGVLLTLTR
jgi:hypothetical protein